MEKRKIEKTLNFSSVHDCFGVTANDVDTLIRNVYINIYSEKRYLEQFFNDQIENLCKHLGLDIERVKPERLIYNNNIERKIPLFLYVERRILDKAYLKLLNSIHFIK